MKINLLHSALAAIVGLAFIGAPVTAKAQATNATSAPAAPAPSDAPKAKDKKEKKKSEFTEYKGTISAIEASSVTVTTAKGDLKLTIDATTTFKVDGKKADASKFAAGDKVSGSYTESTLVAHSLHKKSAK